MSRPPTCRPTRAWRRGWRNGQGSDQEHGPAEAPPEGAEAADDAPGVRGDGRPVLQGERRSPGLLAPALRAGAARAGGPGGPEAAEGGPVPDGQDPGGLRFRRRTEAEQAPGAGATAVRLPRSPREP